MCAAQKAARLALPLFFHGFATPRSSSLCKRTTTTSNEAETISVDAAFTEPSPPRALPKP